MGAIWLLGLPDWLRSAGLPVRTWPGWQTRSRGSGGYDDVRGIGIHHTASNTSPNNDCAWMWDNASYRPIGAVLLDRTGMWTVGAAGATNTQGRGGPVTTSKGVIPQDAGNRYMLSIEAANAGTGEPWPDVMLDSYVAGCAVLAERLGLQASDVIAHFEWTSRKIDPAGPHRYASGGNKWNMDLFRSHVTAAMSGTAPPPPSGGYSPPDSWGLFPLDANKPHLSNGSTGDHVRYLQDAMFFKAGQNIVRDGLFGNQTEGALLNLQRFFGLPDNGICDGDDWSVVDMLVAPPPVLPEPPPPPDDKSVASTGLYWVRPGDSPWSAATRIYGSGSLWPRLDPTVPDTPGFSAANHHIKVLDVKGWTTYVQSGEGPYAILGRLGYPKNEISLGVFYDWNGGEGRTLQPGDQVFMPE